MRKREEMKFRRVKSREEGEKKDRVSGRERVKHTGRKTE